MRVDWYNREGLRIRTDFDTSEGRENMRMIERLLTDFKYKVVEQTHLPDGKWVSTVWLGLDHNWHPGGPPLIFETMVFSELFSWMPPLMGMAGRFYHQDLDQERYSTEAQAREGHERMCQEWIAKSCENLPAVDR